MLVVIGDTHGTDGHRLDGAVHEAVRAADVAIHTGDFTTASVLDAIHAEAANLIAVYGNNDDARVRERLPATRTVEAFGRRFVLAHGHDHDETSLSLLARQEGADAAIVGHSHDPTITDLGAVTLVNPGSYADPRWNRPAYATVERAGSAVSVTLRSPDGVAFDTAEI